MSAITTKLINHSVPDWYIRCQFLGLSRHAKVCLKSFDHIGNFSRKHHEFSLSQGLNCAQYLTPLRL